MTPLHDQVIRGRIAIVRLLLDAGADVNAQDERGWTPLQWVEDPPWGVTPASEDMFLVHVRTVPSPRCDPSQRRHVAITQGCGRSLVPGRG